MMSAINILGIDCANLVTSYLLPSKEICKTNYDQVIEQLQKFTKYEEDESWWYNYNGTEDLNYFDKEDTFFVKHIFDYIGEEPYEDYSNNVYNMEGEQPE